MAKKNLQSLMSGIIGNQQPEQPTASSESNKPSSTNDANEKQVRPGRPRNPELADKVRSTFVIPSELTKKVKYISLMDERLQQDIVADALSEYIAKWETENGKIKLTKK